MSEKPGLGVDAQGGPVVDPTANVVRRQDDLREADNKLTDAKLEHLRDMQILRAEHAKEISDLRAAHAETLRVSDLDRLDKTRQVDVSQATASAAALATAVQTLANTSDRNAETLRNLVNATAQTMAKQTSDQAAILSSQTDSLMKDVNARIAELQKSSYQGSGSPAFAELSQEVKVLRDARSNVAGKSEGFSASWAILLGAVTLLGGIAVLLSRVIR